MIPIQLGSQIGNIDSTDYKMYQTKIKIGAITNGLMLLMVSFVFNYSYIEHFIVWMRIAGMPNFRKLYGRIEQNLYSGTYTMLIKNTFDVSSFEGDKHFVLSTVNAFGGKNYFLAICYIVVGCLCLLFTIIFILAYRRKL